MSRINAEAITFPVAFCSELVRYPWRSNCRSDLHIYFMKVIVGILFFLVALFLCTFLAPSIHQERIERDLGAKVSAVLVNHGLDPSGLEITNHQLTKIGQLPATESASEELRDELDNVIGLYLDLDLTPERVLSPPNFHLAEQVDQSVILTGLIRDESERKFLTDLAATPVIEGGPARTVIDQLEITDDVTAIGPVEKLSVLTPDLLSSADQAKVKWSPSELTLGGIIESPEQQSALLATAAELVPENISPLNELKVQPYQDLDFGLERKDGSIIVTGLLPDKATQNQLLKTVRREAKGSRIIDNTTLATRPRPGWWAENPKAFIPRFLSATKGDAKVHYFHDRFVAKSVFKQKSDHDAVKAQIDGLPAEIKRETDLSVMAKPAPPAPKPDPAPEPNPAAAAKLVNDLKESAIYFGSSSAFISKVQEKKIDDTAKLILASKDVTQVLTVGGYADLRGNADFNRDLSLKRANAVRDLLIAKGVPEARLSVNHFGEDTSKTSKRNLWKSRRVEISLSEVSDEQAPNN